ncbi:hypothetical protein V5799_029378 [Amblyomma americanum]|uniref:Uncharacterized protein n=1 Tax=Amblyomma americanum TaxID=6943 RepID=A0AAQ4ERD3_AMBAM
MTTAKPSVSEKRTLLTLPCPRSEAAPVCQLVRRVAEYNKILWNVVLEIREENGLGELGIAIAPKAMLMNPWEVPRIDCETLARILLRNVLAHHRYIAAVEITFFVARSPVLLSMLQDKYSVRKLTISDVTCCEAKVFEALEKLANPTDQNYADEGETYFCFSVRLPLFVIPKEQSSITLTSLDVADLELSTDCARQLIDILLQNNTISDLTVGSCVFTYDCVDLLHGFVLYLQKHRSPLKKLTVRTPEVSKRALETLVKAIAPTTTLEELVIDIDIYDVEEKALFAEVIARNCILRKLSVTWPRNCVVSVNSCGFELLAGDAATMIEPWLLALPENATLLTLNVDLLVFSEEECCAFFRALALNKALQNINISHLPACADLKELCQIIRGSRLPKAIHIEDHPLSIGSLPMLPEFPK